MQGKVFPDGVDWARGAFHADQRSLSRALPPSLVGLGRGGGAGGDGAQAAPRGAAPGFHCHSQRLWHASDLGIATVYSGVSLWLAVLHQLCGAILLICTVWGAHALGRAQNRA
jgi:cytochrome c oxidase assembly protein subunit 15